MLWVPLANGFVGYNNTASSKDIFNITKAKGEAMIEPDGMAGDLSRVTIAFISFHLQYDTCLRLS